MPDSRHTLGQRGEDFVAERLRRAGYTILTRNWRHAPLGELDIVAHRADTTPPEVVFVEVRTRRGPRKAAAEWALESVDASKQARLVQLALAYLAEHDLEQAAWRIDVAAVGYEQGTPWMEVITNAIGW